MSPTQRRPVRRLLVACAAGLVLSLNVPAVATATDQAPIGDTDAPASGGNASGGKGGGDTDSLLVVLDASGSMLRPDAAGRTRMRTAKSAISEVVSTVPGQVPLGLRVFGAGDEPGRSRAACTDSDLLVPIKRRSTRRVVRSVQGVNPSGWTPIGHALQRSAADLRRSDGATGTVVLVSDGIDECFPEYGTAPCKVAKRLTTPRLKLRVHAVGFTVDARARRQLQCIARVTGGQYSDADDAGSLADALRRSLKPFQLPPTPPEPPAPPILRTVGMGLAMVGTLGAAVVAVRGLLRRRRRAYW